MAKSLSVAAILCGIAGLAVNGATVQKPPKPAFTIRHTAKGLAVQVANRSIDGTASEVEYVAEQQSLVLIGSHDNPATITQHRADGTSQAYQGEKFMIDLPKSQV